MLGAPFELSRAAGQRTGQARALNAVGWFHLQLGAPEKALVHCQLALALHKEIEDQIWQANTPRQHRQCLPPAWPLRGGRRVLPGGARPVP